MKRHLFRLISFFAAVVMALALFACTDKKTDINENRVVITVAADSTFDGSLKDYMDELVAGKKLTYTISNGMVTSINGKENGTSSYWMLYTDDASNSNDAWGTVEVDGKTYASASLGAEGLKIKAGCTYIWEYTEF